MISHCPEPVLPSVRGTIAAPPSWHGSGVVTALPVAACSVCFVCLPLPCRTHAELQAPPDKAVGTLRD